MSEKTYDAIYKIAKNVESDVIVLYMDHIEIRGILLGCNDNKCIPDIITLQDASIKCLKHKDSTENQQEQFFRWLNIPSCHIKAFTFKCCIVE